MNCFEKSYRRKVSKNLEVGGYLSILYRQRQNYIKEKLLNYDIGLTDYPLILILDKSEGLSCNEISKIFFINKSLVSKGSSKLIALGYLKQEKDLNHRQRVNLYLTQAGKEIAPKIREISNTWEEQMMKDLGKEERESFEKILKKIYKKL